MADGQDGQGQGQGQQQGQGSQQQQAKPWYDGKLDAELLGHIENKGWKKDDVIDVAINATKQARELQKHFGVPAEQLMKLPKDNADEAGWAAVRQRLGMPKEAKEYDFSALKMSDGGDIDTAFLDSMRGALHKAGVAKDAAPEIIKAVVKHLESNDASENSERAARITTERKDLQAEWGQRWEENRLTAMQGARRAAGSDEAAAELIQAMQDKIGYKQTMEFFRKIGSGTSEDTFIDSQQGGHPVTRNGAVARLAELQADTAWAQRLINGGAAERRELDNLMQMIHGSAA